MRIKPAARLACLQQLENLLASGIPIIQTLALLTAGQDNMEIRKILQQIKADLLNGNTLYQSVSTHPDLFSPFACQLVRLGEETGKLNQTMATIVAQLHSSLEIRNKVINALFYPCMLLASAILMMICMFSFVIPRFAEIFGHSDKPLPWLTQCIFTVGYMFQTFLLYFVCATVTTSLLVIVTGNMKPVLRSLTKSLLRIPFILRYYQTLAVIQYCRNLAMAIEAGMPLLDAIQLTTAKPSAIYPYGHKIRADISSGMHLHQAMQPCSIFPRILIQMIKTGEETGSLPLMLSRAADALQSGQEAKTARFLQLLEPLIILGLGVLIGGLVAGMYLPIFNLGSAF